MADLYSFKPAEIALLREMARDYRGRRHNLQSRADAYGSDAPSPEMYLAQVPLAGIPGIVRLGTGSSDSLPAVGDTPGSCVCNIYKVLAGLIAPVTGFYQNVYNVAETPIGTGWCPVWRDKFGTWYAVQTQTCWVGVATHHISQNTFGLCNLWTGATASALGDSGIIVEAYSRYGDVNHQAWVELNKKPYGWECIQTACPVGTGT